MSEARIATIGFTSAHNILVRTGPRLAALWEISEAVDRGARTVKRDTGGGFSSDRKKETPEPTRRKK